MINLKDKIRESIPEPMGYRQLKQFSSFNTQMKSIWNTVELTFLLCVIYHICVVDEIKAKFKEITTNDNNNNTINNALLELIGKKLNNLLAYMSSQVQLMKDTFDSIKNYLTDIITENNSYVEQLKKLIIEKILVEQSDEKKMPKKERLTFLRCIQIKSLHPKVNYRILQLRLLIIKKI